MSVVSNIHTISPLTKDSKPLSGQRLVRMIAKRTKDGSYESPNLQGSHCVSIPHINQDHIVDVIDKLLPHVVALCKDTQDKIIREWRITHGRNEIPESVFDVAAIVGYLDASATSDRFTTEYLQEWFMAEYGDIAARYIRAAIDGAAQDIVDAKVNVLRDMFAGFASGRYSPNIPQCKAMDKFRHFVADMEGDTSGKLDMFADKAQDIRAKKEAELSVDALGF